MRNKCKYETNSIWLVVLLETRDPRQTTTGLFVRRNWVLVVAQILLSDSLLNSALQYRYQKTVLDQSQNMAGLIVYSVQSLPRIRVNLYTHTDKNISAKQLTILAHVHDRIDVETIKQGGSNNSNLPNRNVVRILLIVLITVLLSDERNQCTEFYGGQEYEYDSQQNSVHMANLYVDAVCS